MPAVPFPAPWRAACALGLAALLGACATPGPAAADRSGTPTAPGTAASGDPATGVRPPGTPGPTPLAMEQRFLEDWFRGTPVLIASTPPTTLQVDVPLANSFDAGKADVKPALNAVLDRVAQSLLRHSGARLTVSAPTDANGPPALAQTRAERVREQLARKGVAATRVTLADAARGGTPVQLRLAMPLVSSQPGARRTEPPRAPGGVQPVSTQRPNAPAWTDRKP